MVEGEKREWTLKVQYEDGLKFTRRFVAKTPEEFDMKCTQLSNGHMSELHMSVERFRFANLIPELPHVGATRLGWTFVIDIDGQDEDKTRAVERLGKLLRDFDVFYLRDSREHIWFPDWETNSYPNWSQLRDSDEKILALEAYFRYVIAVKEVNFDSLLWSSLSHTIRAPYSYYAPLRTRQIFSGFPLIRMVRSLWDGESIDTSEHDTVYHVNRFAEFMNFVLGEGSKILSVMTPLTSRPYDSDREVSRTDIPWIERLLNTSVPAGFRGTLLWRVILRYLAKNRSLSKDECRDIVGKWLDLCGASRYFDSDLFGYIDSGRNFENAKKYYPVGTESLRKEYPVIFNHLLSSGVVR